MPTSSGFVLSRPALNAFEMDKRRQRNKSDITRDVVFIEILLL